MLSPSFLELPAAEITSLRVDSSDSELEIDEDLKGIRETNHR